MIASDVPFPLPDGPGRHAQLLGDDPLQQAQVEPLLP